MSQTGALRLDLVDVFGNRLKEKVDIYLQHQVLSERSVARQVSASRRITIKNLRGRPQGLYRVEIDPPSYMPVSCFVQVNASGVTDRTVVFPVDPRKVVHIDFPDYDTIEYAHPLLERSPQVLGFENRSGRNLYDSLDDIRKAGLLNILSKCRYTRLSEEESVLDSLLELRELRGDRFFVKVPHALREHVKNSIQRGLFFEVSGKLHRPPDGFTEAGSFKTPDSYGNLQLTFFSDGVAWMADVDIDDAGGLEHAFQVIRNFVTGRPTHPYDIHEILISQQELDPGYRLVLYDEVASAMRA